MPLRVKKKMTPSSAGNYTFIDTQEALAAMAAERADSDVMVVLPADHLITDEEAFRALYRTHTPYLWSLALRLCGGREPEAEEIVQEVFVRLWKEPQRFDPGRGSMRAFLFAQVHGRSVDLLRAETARRAREVHGRAEVVEQRDVPPRTLHGQRGAIRSAPSIRMTSPLR